MIDHIVRNIICFQMQKQLATLNNIWLLYRSVLIDFCACHFVDAKTSLCACCMHAHHRACYLLSPDIIYVLSYPMSLRLLSVFWLSLTALLEKKEYFLWLEKIEPIFDHGCSWMVDSTQLWEQKGLFQSH